MLAFASVALAPRAVMGFYYHPRLAAVVHLVTLGWISSSILGAVYVVGPMALRMVLPARPIDYFAWACTSVGIAGLVSHLWIAEFSGVAWSALTVAAGFTLVAARVLTGLRPAALPRPVKLHVAFAFVNVLGTAAMGVLLGFDKVHDVLPGLVVTNAFAHAHLAAIGWAGMMVVGVGYRLLPMVLPAAAPAGRSLYLSFVLLELGAAGLFVGLLMRSPLVPAFASVADAGFLAFLAHAVWMARRPRRAPPGLPRPDYGVYHVVAALGYLGAACLLGLWLSVTPTSDVALRVSLAYGVFGLVGFLAQIIVGMEARILPVFAWYWAFANSGFEDPVPPPHQIPRRPLQRLAFPLWLVGVPMLAGGLFADVVPLVAAGAWLLLAAAMLHTANVAIVVRHAYRRPAGTTGTAAETPWMHGHRNIRIAIGPSVERVSGIRQLEGCETRPPK